MGNNLIDSKSFTELFGEISNIIQNSEKKNLEERTAEENIEIQEKIIFVLDKIEEKQETLILNSENPEENLENPLTEEVSEKIRNILQKSHIILDSEKISKKLKILETGAEYFPELLNHIENSKDKIKIGIFLWTGDCWGMKILKAIIKKAKEGVTIEIEKDAYGKFIEGKNRSAFYEEFKIKGSDEKDKRFKKNIVISSMGTFKVLLDIIKNSETPKNHQETARLRKDFIDLEKSGDIKFIETKAEHSKYVIIDRSIFLGGINIGSAYEHWMDYAVRVKSILAKNLLEERLNYFPENNKDILNTDFGVNQSKFRAQKNKNPLERSMNIEAEILENIKNAKNNIKIEMAYIGWLPITNEIRKALKRGVKVEITIPEKSNLQEVLNKKTIIRIVGYFNHLMGSKGKLSIYFYPKKHLLHTKVMITDNEIILGSANFTGQGMQGAGELDIFINDKESDIYKKLSKLIMIHQKKSFQLNLRSPDYYPDQKLVLRIILALAYFTDILGVNSKSFDRKIFWTKLTGKSYPAQPSRADLNPFYKWLAFLLEKKI